MQRWDGKVAIVTGASAGIGAAVCEKLVDAGLQVAGLARRKDRVKDLVKKLEGRAGKLYALQADMTKENDILEAFKWVQENIGPVHILINNAGIGTPSTLTEGPIDDIKNTLDTNVLGLTIATREAIKIMRANNIDGHIVNLNSLAGHVVPTAVSMNIYPASKFAVTALTESFRIELQAIGSRIKMTSVSPGVVDTDIFESNGFLENEHTAKILQTAPKLTTEDVANVILYTLQTPPHVQVTELTVHPIY